MGPKWGVKIAPPQFGPNLGSLAPGPKWGVQNSTPQMGMGNGSTASPEVGDGQWLHGFPKVGDRQMAIGRDREGCAPPHVFWVGVWKGPLYVFLGGPLPKKRVALRASPGLVARRLAAMLLCWRVIYVRECRGREKGRDGNAICEEKIGGRFMPSVVLSRHYIVYSISVGIGVGCML